MEDSSRDSRSPTEDDNLVDHTIHIKQFTPTKEDMCDTPSGKMAVNGRGAMQVQAEYVRVKHGGDKWRNVWYDFCQDTSFLKQASEPQPFILRR